MKLFRSHHPDFGDGEQARDFIYVKDVVDVIVFLLEKRPESGLYNLGTGEARSFLDLVNTTFRAMERNLPFPSSIPRRIFARNTSISPRLKCKNCGLRIQASFPQIRGGY